MKEFFVYVLEFMLTFDKIQNTNQGPDHWAKTPDIQKYAYSMKSLNNFQNAPGSDFELFSHKSTVLLHFS